MRCGDPACTLDYPHRHLSAMERIDFDEKVCGCRQIGCCEVTRDAA